MDNNELPDLPLDLEEAVAFAPQSAVKPPSPTEDRTIVPIQPLPSTIDNSNLHPVLLNPLADFVWPADIPPPIPSAILQSSLDEFRPVHIIGPQIVGLGDRMTGNNADSDPVPVDTPFGRLPVDMAPRNPYRELRPVRVPHPLCSDHEGIADSRLYRPLQKILEARYTL
jgi:hypothetical protein